MSREPEPVADVAVRRWIADAAASLALDVPAVAVREHPEDSVAVVLLVRSAHGQVVAYAPVRVQRLDGSLLELVSTDDVDMQLAAIERSTNLVGAGALHRRTDGSVWLEDGIARVAAWTLDGCVTSFYENVVRANFDLPLGSPSLHAPSVAVSFVGWAPGLHGALRHCMARDPGARIHLYGTEGTEGTTIGHVCVYAGDAEDAVRRARHAADYLTGTIEE